MKLTTNFFARMAAVGACSVLAYTAQSQTNNLYNNTTGNQGINYNYTGQAGNEVVLAGSATSDLITYFDFQFDLAGGTAPVGANVNVTFYKNNGANVPTGPGGYPSPSTVLFSQSYSIAGLGATAASQFQLDQSDLGGGVVVPQDFTWTVSFTGLSGGESAGLALYNPPTTGGNYGDAWYNPDPSDTPGSAWQLQATDNNPPANTPLEFGAEFGSSTVPDSSCLPISVLAVMAGFGWVKRFQRRKV